MGGAFGVIFRDHNPDRPKTVNIEGKNRMRHIRFERTPDTLAFEKSLDNERLVITRGLTDFDKSSVGIDIRIFIRRTFD